MGINICYLVILLMIIDFISLLIIARRPYTKKRVMLEDLCMNIMKILFMVLLPLSILIYIVTV